MILWKYHKLVIRTHNTVFECLCLKLKYSEYWLIPLKLGIMLSLEPVQSESNNRMNHRQVGKRKKLTEKLT